MRKALVLVRTAVLMRLVSLGSKVLRWHAATDGGGMRSNRCRAGQKERIQEKLDEKQCDRIKG